MSFSDPLEGLSGTVWPLHLKPRPDELLSSWLIRFAHAHRLKTESMCTLLFGRQSPIWNRDIDRLAPDKVLEGLCRATGSNLARARQTTLAELEGWLSETLSPHGHSHWIVPLGVFHRDRRHPGLMYCPACLATEEYRYYRRLWRLAWATACLTHQCLLVDVCPNCRAPVAPHRADMTARGYIPTPLTFITCYTCQTLLSHQPLVPVSTTLATFQAQLEAALQAGYTTLAGNSSLHSILFFDGLRVLLTSGLRAKKQRVGEKKRSPIFEMRPLAERRIGMTQLAEWMHNWPETFLRDVTALGFRASELRSSEDTFPYWYHQVVQPLTRNLARTSEQEAEAIMEVVVKQTGARNLQAARRLAGKDIAPVWRDTHPRHRPSGDDYEAAVVDIDHQIAGTLDPVQRLLLLRTKFMLVGRYGLRLNAALLSRLTLRDLYQMASPIPAVSFYEVPRSPTQAAAWLLWYWHHIRPQLTPALSEQRVFTSARTHKGLSANACRYWSAIQRKPARWISDQKPTGFPALNLHTRRA